MNWLDNVSWIKKTQRVAVNDFLAIVKHNGELRGVTSLEELGKTVRELKKDGK